MISENFVFDIVQSAAAHQAKICHVLLAFHGVSAVAFPATAEFQSYGSNMPARQRALPEPLPAGSENRPQHTIAWRLRPVPAEARAVSMTENARNLSNADCE